MGLAERLDRDGRESFDPIKGLSVLKNLVERKLHMAETLDATKKLCPHCQKEISKGAKKCPECQSDLRSWFTRHPIISVILVFVLLGFTLSNLDSDSASSSAGGSANDTPSIEIVDVSTRVTEANSVWSKYAWNLTLKNNTDRERTVTAEIKWTDAEGYVVDTDTEYGLVIPANSEKTFNDYDLIDASVAGDIESVEANIN